MAARRARKRCTCAARAVVPVVAAVARRAATRGLVPPRCTRRTRAVPRLGLHGTWTARGGSLGTRAAGCPSRASNAVVGLLEPRAAAIPSRHARCRTARAGLAVGTPRTHQAALLALARLVLALGAAAAFGRAVGRRKLAGAALHRRLRAEGALVSRRAWQAVRNGARPNDGIVCPWLARLGVRRPLGTVSAPFAEVAQGGRRRRLGRLRRGQGRRALRWSQWRRASWRTGGCWRRWRRWRRGNGWG